MLRFFFPVSFCAYYFEVINLVENSGFLSNGPGIRIGGGWNLIGALGDGNVD